MAKCSECGAEKAEVTVSAVFPKLLSQRIAELRAKAEAMKAEEGIELMDILAELEKRTWSWTWSVPNPFTAPTPFTVPYVPRPIPMPYVGDPPGWSPNLPTVVCGGNMSKLGPEVQTHNSVPDATSEPTRGSQWEGPDTYGG